MHTEVSRLWLSLKAKENYPPPLFKLSILSLILFFFQERYNCIIRDHAQPLLVSRPKDKDRRGGRSGPILLIPELCFMTGLTDEQRSDFRLTSCLSKVIFLNFFVPQKAW